MQAERGLLKGLNPAVAITAKAIVIAFLLFAVLMVDTAEAAFGAIQGFIIETLTWYYVLIVAFFLAFAVWLMVSPYGSVKLGGDDEPAEFGLFSWFAMLFGAGMGIGLVFWSIAEPMYHFMGNPFVEEGLTPAAAEVAMRITFFHWGLHPWAIYVIVGLSLSYFAYRRGLPLSIRSALYPLIGERIYGPIGHAVDILAVFATVFGIATSLGFGATQINTGLNYLVGIEISTTNQILVIAAISLVATGSVVSGVHRGIRYISELNLWLSVAIMAFFLLFGPTIYLLHAYLQSIGDYLLHVIPLSLWTDATRGTGWQGGWTAFYWGWWIAWAPFVGMFIARISRGRTIREFVIGALFVPTSLAFLWLTLFGGTALNMELHALDAEGELAIGTAGVVAAVQEDVTLALYETLRLMDITLLSWLFMIVATILICTYFITSSDSGTLVINTLLAGGDPDPPIVHRVIWGIGEGAVAAVLLFVGGLAALQTASIAAALPFSIIMLMMCYGIVRGLRDERKAGMPRLLGDAAHGPATAD